MDYLIRAISENEHIRAFAVDSKNTVEKARSIHNTSPNVTAFLGRILTMGTMMSFMQKEEGVISITIKGDGLIKGGSVSSYERGKVKGFPYVKRVPLIEKHKGKLDIGSLIGKGTLTVIKDIGSLKTYNSQVNLISGEIAEDFTYYFAKSEQVRSAVGLGVLVGKDERVDRAGGFIVQLMPDATEEDIVLVENGLKRLHSVTEHFNEGGNPNTLLDLLLKESNYKILEKNEVEFNCNCSKERVEKALLSIGKKELKKILSEDDKVELKCEYCTKRYSFTKEYIKDILNI